MFLLSYLDRQQRFLDVSSRVCALCDFGKLFYLQDSVQCPFNHLQEMENTTANLPLGALSSIPHHQYHHHHYYCTRTTTDLLLLYFLQYCTCTTTVLVLLLYFYYCCTCTSTTVLVLLLYFYYYCTSCTIVLLLMPNLSTVEYAAHALDNPVLAYEEHHKSA